MLTVGIPNLLGISEYLKVNSSLICSSFTRGLLMSPVEHGVLHEVWNLKSLVMGSLQVVAGVGLMQCQRHPLEPVM